MSIRILLADDHQLIRQGVRALLEREPYFHVVGEASDGRDAVDQVTALRPDVAVVHAQKANRAGDVLLEGIIGVQKQALLAARRSIARARAFSPR